MINDLLHEGKENAIPSRALCRTLGISRRELSRMIEEERRSGFPICASNAGNGGFYLAETGEELEQYSKSLFGRAFAILKTARACVKTASQMKDQ